MKSFIIAAVLITILYFGYKFSGTSTAVPTIGNIIAPQAQEVIVTKIIDGDTVVVEGGEHVRLLGIDTAEKGKKCYSEAKARISDLIYGKKVVLDTEGQDKDQYGRLLRWIQLDESLINGQLVAEGYAIARFYGDSKYKEAIQQAEQNAIDNNIGCLWS